MNYLHSTAGLKAGDKIGVCYDKLGQNAYAVREIARVSPAGNVWLKDDSTPFNKRGDRKAGSWRREYLLYVADAEAMVTQQAAHAKAQRLANVTYRALTFMQENLRSDVVLSDPATRSGLVGSLHMLADWIAAEDAESIAKHFVRK